MSTNNPPPADAAAIIDSHVISPAGGALGTRFESDVRARVYPLAPLARQWLLNDDDIDGATEAAYVAPTAGALTCSARIAGVTLVSAAATVENVAPVNTTPPAIASADTTIGTPVTFTPGVWTGDPTPDVSAVWLVNGVVDGALPDQPFDTNGLDIDDVVSRRETADNGIVATADSAGISFTVGAPVAIGTVADITAEAGTGSIQFSAVGFFSVQGDPEVNKGVTWGITGTDASIDTEGNVTILTASARAESAYVITCTNVSGADTQGFNVTVTASPITVPVLGTPVVDKTGRTITFPLNVPATVYWILSTTASLTKAEIRAPNQTIAAVAGPNTQGITIASPGLQYLHLVADRGGAESNISVAILNAEVEAAAPVLSSLVVTPGVTTASATITTDQAGGTIYRYVSGNVSESGATIIASGAPQAGPASPGTVSLSPVSGLTAETGYNLHVVHVNGQAMASSAASAAFTTTAAPVGGIAINSSTLALSTSTSESTSYTVPAAITDPVGGVLVVIIGYRTSAAVPPVVSGATLGGVTLPLITAPVSYDNSKPWVAIGWLASPPSGALALSFGVGGVENRAMAIEVLDISNVGSWRAAEVFTDPAGSFSAAEAEGAFGAPSPAFTSGDLAIGVIALDGGDIVLPTPSGGMGLVSASTGGTGSSDVTFGVSYDDVNGLTNWTWTGGLSERGLTLRLVADVA